MQLKSLFLVVGLLGIFGVAGCFSRSSAHASPAVVTQKLSEGTLESPASGVFSELTRSRDGYLLAVVKDNKKVGTWDSRQETKDVRVFETSPREWVYGPTFSPDGSLLATLSNTPNVPSSSGRLLLRDPNTGQRLASPDDSLMATPSNTANVPIGSGNGHLLLWDPQTGQRLASVDDLSWPMCCASFNPAGTVIAVAGNTTLYLVDPSTREIVHQAEMDRVLNGVILAIAFNPTGDLLATAKRNGKVELWQVPNLTLVRTFSVGPSLRPASASPDPVPTYTPAVSVSFAHNVPRLAANNSEGSIFVWDVNTGKEIIRYVSNASSAQGNTSVYAPLANSVFFTPDDRWLLTIDQKTNGIRLLGTDRHKETDNVLTVPKHAVMETVNASATDGSVAFTYRIFHPGESDPPTARAEVWSLQLR